MIYRKQISRLLILKSLTDVAALPFGLLPLEIGLLTDVGVSTGLLDLFAFLPIKRLGTKSS